MALGTALAIGSGIAGIAGAASNVIGAATKGAGKQTVDMGPASALEGQAAGVSGQSLTDFQNMINQGAGAQDVAAAAGSQRDLASLLQQMQQTGGMPGAEDISGGQAMAGRLFAGQRQAQSDVFREQQQQFASQAALMGRSPLDPVMRNKIMQEQTRASRQLQAEQFGLGTQLAMQQPEKRLGFAQGRAQVLGGLATQALQNRQALFGMGQQALSSERQLRTAAAGRTTSTGAEGFPTGIAAAGAALPDFMKGLGGVATTVKGMFNQGK